MQMMDLDQIAKAVQKARRDKRLTQSHLAGLARVSRPLITNLETGRLGELGVAKLLRILHVLDLDLQISALSVSRPILEDLEAEEGDDFK